jgi:hypothetical protein
MLVAATRQDALRSIVPGRAGKAGVAVVGPRLLSPKEGGARCPPDEPQPSAADFEYLTS